MSNNKIKPNMYPETYLRITIKGLRAIGVKQEIIDDLLCNLDEVVKTQKEEKLFEILVDVATNRLDTLEAQQEIMKLFGLEP
jgi:hypothetical protein